MSAAFLKTLLFFVFTAMVGAFPCLALDNLEPCIELNRADAYGAFQEALPVTSENLDTELLSVCCPSPIAPGFIAYTLASPQKVGLSVYDQKGSEVVHLVDRTIASGHHRALWDGCKKNGDTVQDGTYYLLMKTEESVKLRKMVLAR